MCFSTDTIKQQSTNRSNRFVTVSNDRTIKVHGESLKEALKDAFPKQFVAVCHDDNGVLAGHTFVWISNDDTRGMNGAYFNVDSVTEAGPDDPGHFDYVLQNNNFATEEASSQMAEAAA